MPPPVPEQLSRAIETLYRSESGRVLATLVRLLGDLDLAEESMHEAFAAALESWTLAGIPDKPRPWLIFTCCHPALPPEGQVALTLREICGLTTEQIARAFLVTPATLAQRFVRAN